MEAGGDKAKKGHKKRVSGQKAKKKQDKDGKVERHNPKAHTFSGGKRSVERRVRYTLEKKSKREHVRKFDKNPDVPPPFVVVVQGPPGVGKTTLIHSLVKHYARQRLLQMRGPVTLVSGRQRRVTIVECPQDMASMLDLAKIADLVLIMIDASFGFELETFEFINIMQVHGFPRIIGVLTHLDGFHDNKQLRKVKKTLKHRFWTEVFDGAKMFHFSGLQYGRYHRLEVGNLARFIAVQKCPLLSWRQSHPYVLGLRWEDHTDPTLPPSHPRRLDVYGYVYGGRLREGMQAHLAGIGDFHIAAIKRLPDPCPPPLDVEAQRDQAKLESGQTDNNGKVKQKKNALRTLAERHRIIYAPGSDVGSITVDSEAMYINVAEHELGFTKRDDEETREEDLPSAVRMVRALQSGEASLDKLQSHRPSLQLLRGATVKLPPGAGDDAAGGGAPGRKRRPAPAMSSAGAGDGDDEDEEADDEESEEEEDREHDSEEDDEAGSKGGEEDEDSDAAHRNNVLKRARERFSPRVRLDEAIYGRPSSAATVAAAAGKARKRRSVAAAAAVAEALAGGPTDHKSLALFDEDGDEDDDGIGGEEGGAEGSASRGRHDAGLLGNLGDIDGLDTARMPVLPGSDRLWDAERKEALKSRKFVTGGWSSAEEDEDGEPKPKVAADGAEGVEAAKGGTEGGEGQVGGQGGGSSSSKSKAKSVPLDPDEIFSDSMPIATFVRVRLEDVPAACVAELRRERLLVLGGLLPGEAQMGLVQVRIKRHRWHPKLLKSNDALLLSVGWRRYQSVPTFSLEDRGEKRMRFLKYSLEHAHCTMTMFGPMVPPNVGVMAFRSWKKVDHFRIAATGGVLESAPNFNIVKKLKLIGEPYKIFKNTAFIKNMFNSDLEVSKYAHTKIQTVSGIRGEIKKAEGTKGSFRATFEDRILMSDLVLCKCWVKVPPKEFYHPVVDVAQWRPARLIGELRATNGMAVPNKTDSQYGKKLVRAERKFNPLKVPKALEASLPFKSKPKNESKKKKNKLGKKAAVVSSDHERAVNSLISRLYTVRKEKHRIRQDTKTKKKAIKEKREQFIVDKREVVSKEIRKKRYIKQGNEEVQKRKKMRLD